MKRDADFPNISEVYFNGDMLFPADFLRAVNYDPVNQLIYGGTSSSCKYVPRPPRAS